MFSVVIPLYNKELSIKNTIQSVLDQTCKDFEIVVVNDGSTDSSARVVEAIDDARIRLIDQKNQGVSAARNRCVQEASYDWVAFLDGDDLWAVDHLQEVKTMMQKFPNEKFFATSFEYSDKRPLFQLPRSESIFRVENYFREAIQEHLISASSVIIQKSCIVKVGGFNEKLKHGEDLDLWARLARNHFLVKSKKVTAVYRVEAENRSNSSYDPSRSLVFNYAVTDALSSDEELYYKHEIVSTLRRYLRSRRLLLFFKLYFLHVKAVSLLHVFKLRKIEGL